MRLIAIEMKNFRIHKSIRIDFDRSLTLIGGPNESGKSTIAEAIHKALFLKASGATAYHTAMQSHIYDGEPEVELVFEIEEVVYTLNKRFSGQNGTAMLSSSNLATLRNDEAESKLSELLKTETGLSRTAYASKWDNLWVWQGSALNDPNFYANNNRTNLIKGLQKQGAAVVLQSPADLFISELFSRKYSEIFNNNGKPKVNSPLAKSQEKLNERKEQYEKSKERLIRLENAALQLERAINEQGKNQTDLDAINQELEQLSDSLRKLTDLRNEEIKLRRTEDQASKELQEHTDLHKRISDLIQTSKQTEKELAPLQQHLENLQNATDSLRNEIESKEALLNELMENNATTSDKKEYYRNLQSLLTTEKEVSRLKNTKDKIDAAKKERDDLTIDLSALSCIDDHEFNRLEKLSQKISRTKVAMESIATSVEILHAKGDVRVNQHKSADKKFTFVNDTTIEIGNDTTLKVIPGGGVSLLDYKNEFEELAEQFNALLKENNIRDLEEAKRIKLRREELEEKISNATRIIEENDPEKVADDLIACLAALKKAEEIDGQYSEKLNLNSSIEKNMVDQKLQDLNRLSEAVGQQEIIIRSEYNALKGKMRDEIAELERVRNKVADLKSDHDGNLNTIQYLNTTHGDETLRLQAIQKAEAARNEIAGSLDSIQRVITELDPIGIEAAGVRMNRSLKNLQRRRDELIEQVAGLKTILRSDGNEDPRESFDKYDTLYNFARQEYDSSLKEAEAVRMLHQLFVSEQEKLSEELTKPLADRVSGYLQCIFGSGISVSIEDKNGTFTGLSISRTNVVRSSPLKFEELSGGAREQVAAAVRLAMAEVLASEYEGCLPVVFDDAFAYSDPDRIKTIQSMLDYAANRRGLQLIVFSCNPGDYKFLGANEVLIG